MDGSSYMIVEAEDDHAVGGDGLDLLVGEELVHGRPARVDRNCLDGWQLVHDRGGGGRLDGAGPDEIPVVPAAGAGGAVCLQLLLSAEAGAGGGADGLGLFVGLLVMAAADLGPVGRGVGTSGTVPRPAVDPHVGAAAHLVLCGGRGLGDALQVAPTLAAALNHLLRRERARQKLDYDSVMAIAALLDGILEAPVAVGAGVDGNGCREREHGGDVSVEQRSSSGTRHACLSRLAGAVCWRSARFESSARAA